MATGWLAEGCDGEAIRTLAGMSRPTLSDIGSYFDKALGEMGLDAHPMSVQAAALIVAKDIAAGILDASTDPKTGAREISRLVTVGDPDEGFRWDWIMGFYLLVDDWGDGVFTDADYYTSRVLESARELLAYSES